MLIVTQLTRLLALCEKLVAALDTDDFSMSKRVKRKVNCDSDLLALCQGIIASVVDKDHNESNNEDGTDSDANTSWIGCMVDQPCSE